MLLHSWQWSELLLQRLLPLALWTGHPVVLWWHFCLLRVGQMHRQQQHLHQQLQQPASRVRSVSVQLLQLKQQSQQHQQLQSLQLLQQLQSHL
jgi:hypothetical protein